MPTHPSGKMLFKHSHTHLERPLCFKQTVNLGFNTTAKLERYHFLCLTYEVQKAYNTGL